MCIYVKESHENIFISMLLKNAKKHTKLHFWSVSIFSISYYGLLCHLFYSGDKKKLFYCVIILEGWKYTNSKDDKSVKMQSCLVFDFKDPILVFLPPQIFLSFSSAQLQF